MDNNTKKSFFGPMMAGNVCILIATIFWGANISVTKALIPDWMTSEGISAVRIVGGCALFWLASLFFRCDRIQRTDWLKLILGGTIGLFGFIYLFVMSLRYANPIDVSIIMTLPPMFVILINVIFRHARPRMLEYLGIVVSFIGAVIIIVSGSSGKSGSDNILGDCIALASSLCYAFYLVILEGPSHTYRPVSMLRWVFLFAAIPGAFLLLGFDHQPIMHTTHPAPWLEIGFILLCPTFIAYFLVQPAIRLIGSVPVSLYQYLVPVFAVITAVMLGIDHLQWIQVIAMAVIVIGMLLTNYSKSKGAVTANSK